MNAKKTYLYVDGLKGSFLQPFLSLQELKEKERLKADNGERDMEALERAMKKRGCCLFCGI